MPKKSKKSVITFLLKFVLLSCFVFQHQSTAAGLVELSVKTLKSTRRYMSNTPAHLGFVDSLKRVLTAGERAHHLLEDDYKPAFFYRHWLERWDTTPIDGKHKFNSYPQTEFERCHSLLADRLDKHSTNLLSKAQVGFYPAGKNLTDAEMMNVNVKLAYRIKREKPFVNGQIVSLQGVTSFPINLFTLAEEGSSFINFGTPLQHGFYFQNLKDYYDAIALLRDWRVYRDLKIVSIPAGVRVNCRIGLIGPQSFPNPEIQYYRDNKTGNVVAESMDISSLQKLYKNLGEKNTTVDNLVESRVGGDVQLMLGYVERYSVYDCGPLCKDEKGNPKKYTKKNQKGDYEAVTGEQIHFLDKEYFKTSFQLENILFSMNTINIKERDEIIKFLVDKKIRKP